MTERPEKFSERLRDGEDRNPHSAYALMVTATVLGVLVVMVGLIAIVTVLF